MSILNKNGKGRISFSDLGEILTAKIFVQFQVKDFDCLLATCLHM